MRGGGPWSPGILKPEAQTIGRVGARCNPGNVWAFFGFPGIPSLFPDLPDLILGHSIYIDVLQLLKLVLFKAYYYDHLIDFCIMKNIDTSKSNLSYALSVN